MFAIRFSLQWNVVVDRSRPLTWRLVRLLIWLLGPRVGTHPTSPPTSPNRRSLQPHEPTEQTRDDRDEHHEYASDRVAEQEHQTNRNDGEQPQDERAEAKSRAFRDAG